MFWRILHFKSSFSSGYICISLTWIFMLRSCLADDFWFVPFEHLLQQFSISHFRQKWVGLGWLFPSFSFLPWPHLNAERVSLCWWAVGWQFCWLVWNMIGVATHDAVKYWWVTEGSRWSSYLLSVMSTDTRQLPSSMPHLPWQRLTP